MSQKASPVIPSFYLYGDEDLDHELDTLHVEPILERSRRFDWIIHPHIHPDHAQILWISKGGGQFQIEGQIYEAKANYLVVQPVAMVHEIRFHEGTEGRVITAAKSYIDAIAQDDTRLLTVTQIPAAYPLGNGSCKKDVPHAFDQLLIEAKSDAPARRSAMRAHFLSVLVSLLRVSELQSEVNLGLHDRDYAILSRFRGLLEEHYLRQKNLAFYAEQIGISAQRLNAACKKRANRTASEVLYERILTEAKRYLLYTEMSVAEIAYALGYEDPAYFNRFFSQRVNIPPGIYRANAATTQRVGS